MPALGFKGLNYGIDFKGGSTWTVLAPGVSQQAAVNAVSPVRCSTPTVEILGGKTASRCEADLNGLTTNERTKITDEVVEPPRGLRDGRHRHQGPPNEVSISFVGPDLGQRRSRRRRSRR